MEERQDERVVMFVRQVSRNVNGEPAGDRTEHPVLVTAVRACAMAAGGKVVKTMGHDWMLSFIEFEAAAQAANAMHEASQADPLTDLAIGIAHGPVIREPGDLFGDTVNLAARLCQLSGPSQTLLPRALTEHLSRGLRASTRPAPPATIKGKAETIALTELLWNAADLTLLSVDHTMRGAGAVVTIRCGEESRQLATGGGVLVLGRSAAADLSVPEPQASRHHARLEARFAGFVLVDQSTNGTWVEADGRRRLVRREQIPLPDRGRLSLGRSFEGEPPPTVVTFEITGNR